VGYMFGQYRRITNRFEAGVFTGKGVSWGGSLVRPEATGNGVVMFANQMLKTQGTSLDGTTVTISGSGNVAINAIDYDQRLGAKVITASDSSGDVVDEDRVEIELLCKFKITERAQISEYAERIDTEHFRSDGSVWAITVDVAIPCATQNELNGDDVN